MNLTLAEANADDICSAAIISFLAAKTIGPPLTLAQATRYAHESALERFQGHATTHDPDGTITFQFEGGALRIKGLYWWVETPALNAHRKRLGNAVRDALRSAEKIAPGNARHAQAEVGFWLYHLDGTVRPSEEGKEEYSFAFEDGTILYISGHGTTWWFGRLYQEDYAEPITLEPERATA